MPIIFLNFWKFHAPLFAGLLLLIGCGFSFGSYTLCTCAFLFLLIPILLTLELKERLITFFGSITLILCAWGYTSYLYDFPKLQEHTKGTAYLKIESIRHSKSPFSLGVSYECKAIVFKTENAIYHNLPCRIYFPLNKKRPSADRDYLVEGEIYMQNPHLYRLKPRSWTPIEKTFSFAEKRFFIKQKFRTHLKKYYPEKRIHEFLSGLATGETEDRLLYFEFGKLGLSHLLAISGFHFALLLLFFSFFLRPFLSRKLLSLCLMLFATAYFVYLGTAASVSRAWIAALFVLWGFFLGAFPRPLNAIGTALIIAILIDPLNVTKLSFALSFIATFAVIVLTPTIDRLLQYFFIKRSKETAKELLLFDKCGYIFSVLIRKGLALNISVTLMTAPLILAIFHKYPLLSFFYNLIIPLMISIIAFFFLLGLLFHPFHFIAKALSYFLLDLIEFYPKTFDFFLYSHSLQINTALLILLPLMFYSIFHYEKRNSFDQKPLLEHPF